MAEDIKTRPIKRAYGYEAAANTMPEGVRIVGRMPVILEDEDEDE